MYVFNIESHTSVVLKKKVATRPNDSLQSPQLTQNINYVSASPNG